MEQLVKLLNLISLFLGESYRLTILFYEWCFIEHWKLLLYMIVILIFFVLGSIYIEDIAIISQISYNLKSLINVDASRILSYTDNDNF